MNQSASTRTRRRIAVIGAGASGICSAKYMLEAGFDVQVFEIGSQIGGLWVYQNDNGRSSAYECLHINSEKRNTQFSDFPFPKEIQYFPDHKDMARYLRSYADHFEVTPRIRFHSRVTSVRPCKDAQGATRWRVEVEGQDSTEFDSVIVCTGHLTVPISPDWADSFTGQYLHSHYYRTPAPFLGKRVLVVGTGNSGCDITADLCVYASRTVMSARSPELIVPKLFLGVPVTQITGRFERRWLPPAVPQFIRKWITRIVHGRMEDWGFRTPTGPTHPTSHATLINHIAYNRVKVRPGISKVNGQTVHFTDGSSEEFDAIIGATGYEIDYKFVTAEMLPLVDGRADLFKRIVPIDFPGLYYVGLFNTLGSSNLRMFEVQSRWIRTIEKGDGLLPDRAEMLRDIKARNAYIAQKFPAGRRHAVEIEPIFYTRELERDARIAAERADRIRREQGQLPAALRDSRSVESRPIPEGALAVPGTIGLAA